MTPTTRDTAELLALKRKLAGLNPADRLRLAARLVEAGKHELAEVLVQDISAELYALRVARNQKGRT